MIPKIPKPFKSLDYQDDSVPQPRTLAERRMVEVSAKIREKPEWWKKVRDPTILKKWLKESSQRVSHAQAEFVLDELKYLAENKVTSTAQISPVDGVWLIDGALDSLQTASGLLQEIENLKSSKWYRPDWHPGSNNQVLDLVHPSLWCYLIGTSPVTSTEFTSDDAIAMMGNGIPQPLQQKKTKHSNDMNSKSFKFAWLPAEVVVPKGKSAVFLSYINNIHPKLDMFYKLLGDAFTCAYPLLERVLEDIVSPQAPRIHSDISKWYPNPPESYNEDGDSEYDDEEEWNRGELTIPDISGTFKAPSDKTRSHIDLCNRRLQVIVKVAEIVLTPNNSKYAGGVWHVEGMENENIVASAIAYLRSDNITESRLAFRRAIQEPNYEQNDDNGVEKVYGFESEETVLNEHLGSVITKAGRIIAFPNVFQHQIQPFELLDKTLPGIRTIVVFFLVDPNERVVSTSTVPPQQPHWATSRKHMSGTVSLKQAELNREELMVERKYFVDQNNELVFEREFSLCEH